MAESIESNDGDDLAPVYREPRVRKLVKIELFASDGATHPSIVRNLSRFGLRATLPIPLRTNQSIEIGKPGYGKVKGTVRWVGNGEFGMQFDEPVDVDQFDFGSKNTTGHFIKKPPNGHVWRGFQTDTSAKRPGLRTK